MGMKKMKEDVVDDNIDPDAPEADGYVSEDDDIQPAGPCVEPIAERSSHINGA